MKRITGVLLVLLGVGLVLLGLLFITGAAGRAQRYLVAILCLALGGALAGLGVRLFRQAEAASPEQLRAEILELARRRNGEVGLAELEALLGRRAAGAAVLASLQDEGICERQSRDGSVFLVFKELLPRLAVRRCEYCQAELPLAKQLATCPACGGTIKTQVEALSLEGQDVYRMDE